MSLPAFDPTGEHISTRRISDGTGLVGFHRTPWPRVYAFFARWWDTGLAAELHDRLRGAVREAEGSKEQPSAAVVDSQSVKADATVPLTSRGYDAGKKINGRKRHPAHRHARTASGRAGHAGVHDRPGRRPHPAAHSKESLPAAGADLGRRRLHRPPNRLDHPAPRPGPRHRPPQRRRPKFPGPAPPLGRRKILAWFLRSRRLVLDYERRTDTSETVILWSMTMLMSRRLAAQHRQRPAPARAA